MPSPVNLAAIAARKGWDGDLGPAVALTVAERDWMCARITALESAVAAAHAALLRYGDHDAKCKCMTPISGERANQILSGREVVDWDAVFPCDCGFKDALAATAAVIQTSSPAPGAIQGSQPDDPYRQWARNWGARFDAEMMHGPEGQAKREHDAEQEPKP